VTLDAFSEWEPRGNRPFVILGSHKGSACRSRFDAAHELAHQVLHRAVNKSDYRPNAAFSLIEEQAHKFAAAFLLPAETFGQEVGAVSLDALLSLKQRWRVSVAAIIKRISQLRLIDAEQEKRLWMNLSRRKWRTVEPLDDIIEPEKPTFLPRCFDALVRKKVISPDEIPFQLGLPSVDIEQLIGLPPRYFDGQDDDILRGKQDRGRDSYVIRFPSAS